MQNLSLEVVFNIMINMKFVDTEEILNREKMMIERAKDFLYIFSPYLQISEQIEKSLIDTQNKNPELKISLVYGKDKLNATEKPKLERIIGNHENFRLFYVEDLHAKIMINEKYALLSSMNLYDSSKQNYETGIYFSKTWKTEKTAFINLLHYCESIIDGVSPINITAIETKEKNKPFEKLFEKTIFMKLLDIKKDKMDNESWERFQNDILKLAEKSSNSIENEEELREENKKLYSIVNELIEINNELKKVQASYIAKLEEELVGKKVK